MAASVYMARRFRMSVLIRVARMAYGGFLNSKTKHNLQFVKYKLYGGFLNSKTKHNLQFVKYKLYGGFLNSKTKHNLQFV